METNNDVLSWVNTCFGFASRSIKFDIGLRVTDKPDVTALSDD